jgi:hypothetical protein
MPFTQGHALVVGIGAYSDAPGLAAPVVVADAKAVASVLRDPQF